MSGPDFGSRMRCGVGRADELVAAVGARRAQHRDLRVLREVVVDLAVARLDLEANAVAVQHVAARQRLHARDELVERVAHDEVGALVHERLDRAAGALAEPRSSTRSRTSLPVRSGFCSLPESVNSFSMIFCDRTNHEWSWPVARRWASVPSVSKPGNSGTGRRLPVASSQIDEGPGRIRMP